MVIEALAEESLALRAELIVRRQMVEVAVDALHEEQLRTGALEARLSAIREELRRFTAAQVR